MEDISDEEGLAAYKNEIEPFLLRLTTTEVPEFIDSLSPRDLIMMVALINLAIRNGFYPIG